MGMTPHALGLLHSLHLGQVVDNRDPQQRGRIKVLLQANEMELWASVVTPSAGGGYGVACLPRNGEIVVLAFITPEMPLVLGSIWSGQGSIPDDADPVEDHYMLRTPRGTVLEMDDGDGPKLEIRTPQGYKLTLTDGNGGEVLVERGTQSLRMTASAITIQCADEVKIEASRVHVSAGMVQVDAGMSKFSGVVQADTLIANAVVGTSYTPGAGNIW